MYRANSLLDRSRSNSACLRGTFFLCHEFSMCWPTEKATGHFDLVTDPRQNFRAVRATRPDADAGAP